MFTSPQVNVYARDVARSVEFYRAFGFEETFRTPREGDPIHVELQLDGFTLGVAAVSSAIADHGLDLDPDRPGRGMEVAIWTDDVDGVVEQLAAAGAPVLSEPHDWLDSLRVAWVADPDGNPVELVQRRP
ncbi:VOC family protein [Jiangella asiatica]|uniref:Glyoxalase/bleomycin resistance/dioxygenase family protein n=1 Tax=Jiangella asiatica TaxID=2530372 RepID=A0A4R5CR78_9ACTN|nr:VOC family protein [Jiangella asiatica]TDE00133.1 glyoxalase/bleomycin resistance/dioxygenase family protein [Jiangella asiatica]